MSQNQEITVALAAARTAQKSRPEWTSSWYAIGRAIAELEHALTCLPFEVQFGTQPDAQVVVPFVRADNECIHPGVFATDKAFSYCVRCDKNIPRSEL